MHFVYLSAWSLSFLADTIGSMLIVCLQLRCWLDHNVKEMDTNPALLGVRRDGTNVLVPMYKKGDEGTMGPVREALEGWLKAELQPNPQCSMGIHMSLAARV